MFVLASFASLRESSLLLSTQYSYLSTELRFALSALTSSLSSVKKIYKFTLLTTRILDLLTTYILFFY